jgi:hypothetical protein
MARSTSQCDRDAEEQREQAARPGDGQEHLDERGDGSAAELLSPGYWVDRLSEQWE